jgi:hypothetical protein
MVASDRMARMTSTGHRKLGQRLSWGEPRSQFKVWTAPRLAVPAKRKTALRMAFSKCNLETPSYAVTPSNWDFPVLRRNAAYPRPAKPRNIIAQVDGSGTPEVTLGVTHERASRTADIRVPGRHGERIDMLERIRILRRVGPPSHSRVRRRWIVKDEGQNLTSRHRVAENDGIALGRTVIEKARYASGYAVDIEADILVVPCVLADEKGRDRSRAGRKELVD